MSTQQGSSPRALRCALRRASREQRRAGAALRHVERYGDAVTTALLDARLRLAELHYKALLRLAVASQTAA